MCSDSRARVNNAVYSRTNNTLALWPLSIVRQCENT